MKRQLLASLAIAAFASVSPAFGHGFLIDVVNNKLVLQTEDPTAGGNSIYKVQALLGPAAFRSTDHPGYDVAGGIANGDSISFNVLSPLWYSPGAGAPIHSPVGVNMVITPQDFSISGSVTATGTSGFQTGFLIGQFDGVALGAYEHQLNYEIDVPGGVPVGAYAIALQLTGVNAANQPFLASDPFVAVFNNGLQIGGFPAVANQLYTAAMTVPEPSSIMLAALAGAGVIAFGRRRLLSRKA